MDPLYPIPPEPNHYRISLAEWEAYWRECALKRVPLADVCLPGFWMYDGKGGITTGTAMLTTQLPPEN